MTTTPVETPNVEQTEHPHIVRTEGICGGRPHIKGSRISVRHIAVAYKVGDTVEEILQQHAHLTPASVFDAISYYLDHQEEIEQEIVENRLESLRKKHNLEIDEQGFVQFEEKASSS